MTWKSSIQRLMGSALILMQLNSCSALKQSTEIVSVTSDPPDAEIYINGNMVGRGTASQPVMRTENVQIMVRKGGFETEQRSIGTHMSTTAVLDIFGGLCFLVPFIGLATPGARDLDQTNIAVTLRPALASSDATVTPHSR